MKQPLGVCITDTHLAENTIEVNKKVFSQLWDLCKERNLNTIYHGGDIFTSRKGQPEVVVVAFKELLDETYRRGLKIIAIAGNHDKTDYTSSSSFLDAFDGHPSFSVVAPYGSLIFEDTIIHFLPYYDEELSYNEQLRNIHPSDTAVNILITHIGMHDIKNNGGSKVESEVKQDQFDCFDTVLVGHYHDRQIAGSRDHIHYIGSAYQADFGENIDKGATIIYSDGSLEFVPFDFPQYVTIDILARDVDSELLRKTKEAKGQLGGDLQVKYKVVGEIDPLQEGIVKELQSFAKVEVIKESFKPMDVIQSESVQITSNDILDLYDQWTSDRNIENAQYGKQLLQKAL